MTAVAGSKVFFLGGTTNINVNELSKTVDVHDTSTGSFEVFELTEAKYRMGVEVIDDKIILAGGQISNNPFNGLSELIEVIDVNDYSVSTRNISVKNSDIVSLSLGSKAIFYGRITPTIEVYDVSDNSLVSFDLGGSNTTSSFITGLGSKLFVAPFNTDNYNLVGLIDLETNSIDTYDMGYNTNDQGCISHKWKTFLAGGKFGFNDPEETIHIYTHADLIPMDNDNDGYTADVDCDDTDASINPGAAEVCNGIDDNCDGDIDEGLTFTAYFVDGDMDGFGDPMNSTTDCQQPTGTVTNGDDCDDTDAGINPDAEDIANNGIDEDCDGMDTVSTTHELDNATINIYPNPSSGILNLIITGDLKYTSSLYSLSGKLLILDLKTSNDISALADGIYLLIVEDNLTGNRIVDRVILAR